MKVKVVQSCPTLCNPVDCTVLGASVHGILQARILEWVAVPFSRDLPNLGWNPGLLHCRRILYPLSHQKERKKVVAQSCLTLCDPMDCSPPGSFIHGILQARILEWVAISLPQEIFLTQGLNPGLLHCRQTLYHLSHQGSLSHIKPTGIECFVLSLGGFGFSFYSLSSSLVSLLASLPLPPIPPCSLFFNSRKNTGQSRLHTSCFCVFAYVMLLARVVSLTAPQPTLLTLYSSTQVPPLPGRPP